MMPWWADDPLLGNCLSFINLLGRDIKLRYHDAIRAWRADDPLGRLIQSEASLNKFQIIDTIISSQADQEPLGY